MLSNLSLQIFIVDHVLSFLIIYKKMQFLHVLTNVFLVYMGLEMNFQSGLALKICHETQCNTNTGPSLLWTFSSIFTLSSRCFLLGSLCFIFSVSFYTCFYLCEEWKAKIDQILIRLPILPLNNCITTHSPHQLTQPQCRA